MPVQRTAEPNGITRHSYGRWKCSPIIGSLDEGAAQLRAATLAGLDAPRDQELPAWNTRLFLWGNALRAHAPRSRDPQIVALDQDILLFQRLDLRQPRGSVGVGSDKPLMQDHLHEKWKRKAAKDSFLACWACLLQASKGLMPDFIVNSQAVLLMAACWEAKPDRQLAGPKQHEFHHWRDSIDAGCAGRQRV